MKKHFFIYLLLLVFLSANCSSRRLHETKENPFGTVASVKGKVTILRGAKKLKKPKTGDKLYYKDKVKTGKASRISIQLIKEGNNLTISRSAKMTLLSPKGKKNNRTIEIESGGVRCKLDNLKQDEVFNLKTPVAVVGVRGTDFVTIFTPGATQQKALTLTVISGAVEVKNVLKAVEQAVKSVVVKSNQRVVISSTGTMAPVISVSRSEMKKVIKLFPIIKLKTKVKKKRVQEKQDKKKNNEKRNKKKDEKKEDKKEGSDKEDKAEIKEEEKEKKKEESEENSEEKSSEKEEPEAQEEKKEKVESSNSSEEESEKKTEAEKSTEDSTTSATTSEDGL